MARFFSFVWRDASMAGGNRGSEHPSLAELNRFLRGELSPQAAAPVVAHLLIGCKSCCRQMAPLAALILSPQTAPPEVSSGGHSEYDFPLFRAFAKARRHAAALEQERSEAAHEHFPKALPPPAPLTAAQRARRDMALCQAFIERCRTLRHSDPEGAQMLASFAVSLAERIEPHEQNAELPDLQARAWAELGNARRVAGDLAEAESDLGRAMRRAEQGSGDRGLLVQLMDLTASLLVDQQRFAEAMQLLDGVERMHRSAGDLHAAGRALVSKGTAAGLGLNPQEAVRLLIEALQLLDARRDPDLVFMTVHNLLSYLVDCGRSTEAARLYAQSRVLYARYPGRLDRLKARWLEGRIAAAQGDDTTAEAAFQEVQTGFAAVDLPYDAALASIQLADIWLRTGRTREIKGLVDEMVTIFRAHNIRREVIGALLMLREACEREGATVALLRTVTRELQRLERER
jgi:tetratricopeptide (TPR) repeat protein